MEKFMQCECCGAELQPPVDGVTVECEYCGRKIVWKEPKSESLILALNRANNFRRANRFSDAIMEYRLITERNPQDAEAWWGLTVSTYGIEYVKDPRGGYVPTCHRTVREEIFTNGDYKKAITNAAESQRAEYENEAKEIDRLQKEILRLVDEGEDYDVFVSFKSKDLQGRMTKDASVARNIYDELTNRGIKTFFSDVTLSNKLFTDYEPIIYRALTSCKYFILVATSEKNLNSEWVKNEWSRFEERMEKEKLSGVACAVFEGGEVKELPPFLRAQGVDLRQYPAGGYEKVIADNIERKLGKKKKSKEEEEILRQIEEQKKAQRELEERLKGIQKTGVGDSVPAANMGMSVESLLVRARQEAEVGNWDKARDYYTKAIDSAPRNAEAWFGLACVDFHLIDGNGLFDALELKNTAEFLKNKNLAKTLEYATGDLKDRYQSLYAELEKKLSDELESEIVCAENELKAKDMNGARGWYLKISEYPQTRSRATLGLFLISCNASSLDEIANKFDLQTLRMLAGSKEYRAAVSSADEKTSAMFEAFRTKVLQKTKEKTDALEISVVSQSAQHLLDNFYAAKEEWKTHRKKTKNLRIGIWFLGFIIVWAVFFTGMYFAFHADVYIVVPIMIGSMVVAAIANAILYPLVFYSIFIRKLDRKEREKIMVDFGVDVKAMGYFSTGYTDSQTKEYKKSRSETEEERLKRNAYSEGQTTVLITQNLSAYQSAEKILNGEIVGLQLSDQNFLLDSGKLASSHL